MDGNRDSTSIFLNLQSGEAGFHPPVGAGWPAAYRLPIRTKLLQCSRPTCYEGVTNPAGPGNPEMVHQVLRRVETNRVYMPYGVSSTGVFQILDRQKLLTGCTVSADPTDCPNNPSQVDLLYPQISYTTTNPNQGGHHLDPDLRGADPAGAGEVSRRHAGRRVDLPGHFRRHHQ